MSPSAPHVKVYSVEEINAIRAGGMYAVDSATAEATRSVTQQSLPVFELDTPRQIRIEE